MNKTESMPYECHMISPKTVLPRTVVQLHTQMWLLFAFLSFGHVASAQTPVASYSVVSNQGCVPFNVVFTNTSQSAVSYQWDFGNGNTSTAVNPTNVYTTAGTYTVTLIATASGGATNTYTGQIVVNPKPVAGFSVSSTSGCQNTHVFNFNNLSSNFDSCTWDFGDGTTSNQLNPVHIYSIHGTFNVTLVVYNRAYGCSDVKIQNALINILPAPTAQISLSDSVTCNLQTNFQFNAVFNNAISWNWMFGDGTSSSIQNPSHVYSDTGYYNPSVILTSANGCIDTVDISTEIHIKWNPVPAITVSADSVCEGELINFQATYYANSLYSWNMDDSGAVMSGANTFYRYWDGGNYGVQLTVNYSNGCTRVMDTVLVVVFDKPIFTFSLSNHTGCAPLNVITSNNPYGGVYSWLWDFGDGTTSTLQNPGSHIYANSGQYSVTVTATNSFGCTFSYTQGQKVTVRSPSASFSTDVNSGCPPLTVNFSNASTTATSFLWLFGDGNSSTATHPTHVYTTAGVYTVTLIATDATGCSDTLVVPNKITVAVPVVNYQAPPTITGCAPYSVNFSDASGAASFLWDFGDGTTSTLSNPYHIYQEPGTYVVQLTTWMPNGGCEQHISNFQTFIIDGGYPGFTYTVSPCPPYEVFFTDTSLNTVGWQWSFGDGGSSTVQNPSHIYPGPGTYNVTLVVTTPAGCSTTLQANNSVVINGIGANASAVCTDTTMPLDVQFYANSQNATWWLWDFGDGTTSTLQNPLHVYTVPGPYHISLTVGNDSCTFTYDYPPISFGASTGSGGGLGGGVPTPAPREYHCAPYTVNFSNPDPNALAWLWDFGDGDTSTLSSPEHAYLESGSFIATLYLTTMLGVVDTFTYSDTFFVVKPVSDFDILATNLCGGVQVDVSINVPALNYLWNFGNGTTSTLPAASFTYPNVNSSYMISLNVTDTFHCSSFVAKSFAVNATSPLSVSSRRTCAGDSITFNTGNLNFAQYLWNFGDGNTSTDKNPGHAYSDSGVYAISLDVTDINGCVQTFTMANNVEVFDPVANFSLVTTLSNCQNGTVVGDLTNLSTGSTSWYWDFGDGTSSVLFTPPQHGFYLPNYNGYYGVMLIAKNNICSDTMFVQNAVYGAQLEVDFTYTTDSECVPSAGTFTDASHDAVSWFWDFGDGDTSSLQNPVHIYQVNPTDSITLTVWDLYGCVKTKSLAAPELTEAKFSVSEVGGCAPFATIFSDSSENSVSCFWTFGDGQTSAGQFPSHSYLADGFYDVSLIATSASGCTDTLLLDSLVEVNTPSANFIADSLVGCSPLLIDFDDLSTNAMIWEWDFGNGSVSGNQFPSLIYTMPGIYTVSLIVENKFGCLDSFKIDSMVVVRGAIPDFTLSSTSGCAPLAVSFQNNTIGGFTYEWNFGDGIKDTVLNPSHTFNDPGNYTVSLFAYDSSGCSSIYTYPQTIQVGASPVVSFYPDAVAGCAPLLVNIIDAGTVADSLVWLMGDGTVLYGNSPQHTYTTPGNYLITLVAYNNEGCVDSVTFPDTIFVNEQPVADFNSDIQEGCNPVQIQFTDYSQNLSNATFNWDFGNGDFSNVQNPQYSYTQPGIYTVTLIVTNDGGCSDTITKVDYIDIFDPAPPPVTPLYHVTVNSTDVLVEWELTTVHDLDYYVVYRYNNLTSQFDSIAQVFQPTTGVNNNIPFYSDAAVAVNNSTYAYKIQTVDKCGKRPDLLSLKAHETILLSTTAGHQKVDLTWTPYQGCDISGYEVYRMDNNNGAFGLVASLDSSVHSFVDSSAVCPMEYIYRITATAICGNSVYSSNSNESAATPTSNIASQMVDVTRATVVEDEYVLIEWAAPAILPDMVDRYDIYRSTDQVNYQLVASVPNLVLDYSDLNVEVDDQEYYYKIFVQNICNVTTTEGVPGSSILLQKIEYGTGYMLKWTQYVQWDSGVEYFVIERLNKLGNWEEVDRVPGNITEWEEK